MPKYKVKFGANNSEKMKAEDGLETEEQAERQTGTTGKLKISRLLMQPINVIGHTKRRTAIRNQIKVCRKFAHMINTHVSHVNDGGDDGVGTEIGPENTVKKWFELQMFKI